MKSNSKFIKFIQSWPEGQKKFFSILIIILVSVVVFQFWANSVSSNLADLNQNPYVQNNSYIATNPLISDKIQENVPSSYKTNQEAISPLGGIIDTFGSLFSSIPTLISDVWGRTWNLLLVGATKTFTP